MFASPGGCGRGRYGRVQAAETKGVGEERATRSGLSGGRPRAVPTGVEAELAGWRTTGSRSRARPVPSARRSSGSPRTRPTSCCWTSTCPTAAAARCSSRCMRALPACGVPGVERVRRGRGRHRRDPGGRRLRHQDDLRPGTGGRGELGFRRGRRFRRGWPALCWTHSPTGRSGGGRRPGTGHVRPTGTRGASVLARGTPARRSRPQLSSQ